ncbi:hypothetical protein [Enterococcus faecalis]|uniref:hypothetical protein n=1 Tax=Enterococcus faecalis TaxID=1351 RepID=UPI00178655C7|nr:hypothetical protein [Enterococcus faecalis]MBD9836218.1 hypothetical protein [Enterococcus faecalis]
MSKKNKLQRSEKLRLKNIELRKKGKDPLKGWGKMVDGLGGGGGVSGSVKGNNMAFDRMGAVIEEQKQKRKNI